MLPVTRHPAERGSEFIEFGLVLIPLLTLVAFSLDLGWLFFAKASLQYAVQQGVRYAITGQTATGSGQDASVKSVVQQNAFSFLQGTAGYNQISVNYYSPQDLSTPLYGVGSNAGGNVVAVSVSNVSVTLLVPGLLPGSATSSLSAVSTDITEPSPNGVTPAR